MARGQRTPIPDAEVEVLSEEDHRVLNGLLLLQYGVWKSTWGHTAGRWRWVVKAHWNAILKGMTPDRWVPSSLGGRGSCLDREGAVALLKAHHGAMPKNPPYGLEAVRWLPDTPPPATRAAPAASGHGPSEKEDGMRMQMVLSNDEVMEACRAYVAQRGVHVESTSEVTFHDVNMGGNRLWTVEACVPVESPITTVRLVAHGAEEAAEEAEDES